MAMSASAKWAGPVGTLSPNEGGGDDDEGDVGPPPSWSFRISIASATSSLASSLIWQRLSRFNLVTVAVADALRGRLRAALSTRPD